MRKIELAPDSQSRLGMGCSVLSVLRRAGWEDETDWPPTEWRGGGPEAWAAGPADGPGGGP